MAPRSSNNTSLQSCPAPVITLISNIRRNNQDNRTTTLRAATLPGQDSFAIILRNPQFSIIVQKNILTVLLFIASSKFRSSDIQGKMRNEKDGIDWWSFPIVSTLKSWEVANMKNEMWCIYQLMHVMWSDVMWCHTVTGLIELSCLKYFFLKKSLAFKFLPSCSLNGLCQTVSSVDEGAGGLWQKRLGWICNIEINSICLFVFLSEIKF